MPELPEVETVRLDLQQRMAGRVIDSMKLRNRYLRTPVPLHLPSMVAGRRVKAVRRRAKYLLVDMAGGSLGVHLGMTGSVRADRSAHAPRKHDHVELHLRGGAVLRYNDPRRFGSIFWIDDEHTHRLLANCGMEPLEPGFRTDTLLELAEGSSRPIKSLLMDNSRIAGIGNIYATEILFACGIHPALPSARITRAQATQIVRQAKRILRKAIAVGGSTLRDYRYGDEKTGYFQFSHKVYGKQGQPCQTCTTEISRMVLSNRSSFFCPVCQTLP